MVLPAAATCLAISGCHIACSPISKNVALRQLSASALSTAGVFSGHGPSSKVSTTSPARRKSYCLKCSKPKPGPPVVSISTMRARPMPPGLSQTPMLAAGAEAPAWSVAVAAASVGRAVFSATRCGAAGAGGGDGAAMIDAGAAGAGGADWTDGRRERVGVTDRRRNRCRRRGLGLSGVSGASDAFGRRRRRCGRKGTLLRRNDSHCRETQGHQRGNDDQYDLHRTPPPKKATPRGGLKAQSATRVNGRDGSTREREQLWFLRH